jgi:ferredoxin, 2Fe-2S
MATVKFTFEDKNIKPVSLNIIKGDNILDLAENNGLHINNNCGGVCACSTCHVYVEKGGNFFADISDREEDFIDRAVNPRLSSRLSCQCEFLKNYPDAIIEVHVPDQSRIIGHEH